MSVTKDIPVGASTGLSALLKNTRDNFAKWGVAMVRKPLVRTPPLPPSAFIAIILTLAVATIAMFGIDTAASDWAHRRPQWFIHAFEEITNFGLGGWFLIPSAFVFLCLAAVAAPTLPRITQGVLAALAARFGFLFLAVGGPGLFDTIIKRLIGRARPHVGGHDDPFAYTPFSWRSEYASMPSGHSANVAAAAIAIGALWPKMRPAMWLFALLIMFSRVVVLAHHPSDVIVGALVGAIGAVLVRRWFAARRLVFSGHELKAFPGPSLRRAMAAARQILFGS
jgi:membrane-associated phospholipid phosphatase